MDDNKALNKVMEILGEELVKKLVAALKANDKSATGGLIKSVDYKIIKKQDEVILQLIAADYLKYVDEGRKPGKMPPLKALDKWIIKRGIAPRDKKGKFIPRASVKFLIARSIGKNGIKGIHVVRKTIDEVYSKKQQLIAEAASKDFETMIDKIIIKK